jgi:threonine synthase
MPFDITTGSVAGAAHPVVGWRCQVCDRFVAIADAALMWRCPNSTPNDRRHTMTIVQSIMPLRAAEGVTNGFRAFQRYLAWDAFAAALGLSPASRAALVDDTDAAIARVAGSGFWATPLLRNDALSDEFGFSADGGMWLKDETNSVAGSHKARHLFTILLHLLATEMAGAAPWRSATDRPRLAIASCGNAALAASTLAAAVGWPISVFVPPFADPAVLTALHSLNADVVTCPRLSTDPPGDPCIHRFRDAVAGGAVPFSVQGPENMWCLDGGRTIGWEMARHMEESIEGPPFDRVVVQVGAGAFAASVMAGFRMSGITPRLHAVQTEACAPLARAWRLLDGSSADAARRWADLMWPWEQVGESLADGILDDETYDWLPVVGAMADGHGSPVTVNESDVARANQLIRQLAEIDASFTGSAGLAGVVALQRSATPIGATERVVVVASGVRR